MRGIEPTKMVRVYQADNDRLTNWITIKNNLNNGKKIYRADAIRAIIKENQRLRMREKYLQFKLSKV